jgi:hypothetical protein
MDYSKTLLKYLRDITLIETEDYSKDHVKDISYFVNNENMTKDELIDELSSLTYSHQWASDLMVIINQLAWMLLHERKQHKKIIKELKDSIKQIEIKKLDYSYDHGVEIKFNNNERV